MLVEHELILNSVQLARDISHNLEVGCDYFPPGRGYLPSCMGCQTFRTLTFS